jgi:peptidoglycan biosynthesis protein MviN/MurJ (putative lipid II flippase)
VKEKIATLACVLGVVLSLMTIACLLAHNWLWVAGSGSLAASMWFMWYVLIRQVVVEMYVEVSDED